MDTKKSPDWVVKANKFMNWKVTAALIILALLINLIPIFFKDDCVKAKEEAAYYFGLYMESMLQGKKGASVPGAEAPEALERAKRICKRADLTFENIIQDNNRK